MRPSTRRFDSSPCRSAGGARLWPLALLLVASACGSSGHGTPTPGGGNGGKAGGRAGSAGVGARAGSGGTSGGAGGEGGSVAGGESGDGTGDVSGAGHAATGGRGGTGAGGVSGVGAAGLAGGSLGGFGNSGGVAGAGESGAAGASGESGGGGDDESGRGGQGGAAGEPEFVAPLVPRHGLGAQNTVVILLSHDPMPGTGPDDPASILGVTVRIGEIDASLRKYSYGQAWLGQVRVLGPYAGAVTDCTSPFSPGNSDAVARYAIARADDEVDFRTVDRIIVMLMNDAAMLSCDINPNGGFSYRLDSADGPFSAGLMMMKVYFPLDPPVPDPVAVHEFIHTFGTGHVTTLDCYDDGTGERVPYAYTPGTTNSFPSAQSCPTWEFSPIDLMGEYQNVGANLAAPTKKQFGWIDEANIVTARAGTFTLAPLDASVTRAGTLMIQIPIPYTSNSYTLEHRAEGPTPGVYVYLSVGGGRPPYATPYLLSTAPFDEPGTHPHPLALGVTTLDAAMGLSVEVTASDVTGATLHITSDPTYVTQCTDGVPNETSWGAGRFDQDDFSCQAGDGLSELEPAPACFDSLDNDGDGRTDEQDSGCTVNGEFDPESDQE